MARPRHPNPHPVISAAGTLGNLRKHHPEDTEAIAEAEAELETLRVERAISQLDAVRDGLTPEHIDRLFSALAAATSQSDQPQQTRCDGRIPCHSGYLMVVDPSLLPDEQTAPLINPDETGQRRAALFQTGARGAWVPLESRSESLTLHVPGRTWKRVL